MKRLALAGAAAGLALLIALVAWEGWQDVLHAFARAGWPLLLLVPLRVATLALDAWAWRILLLPLAPARPPGLAFLLWVASVREAVNRLLPVAGVGGEVVGLRLARTRIPDTPGVAASLVVEVLLTIAVLYLFGGVGVVLMAHIAAGMDEVWTIGASLLLSLPLPLLAWWLLHYGDGTAFQRIEHWAARLLGPSRAAAALDGAALDAALAQLGGRHGRLLRALLWQLLGYVAGSVETWYALRLLGHPVDATTAVAIEALTQAVRHAGFLVPAGLGVQEAATVLFGHLAGVGGDVALSLALAKRMRELVLGVPALLSWHWFEAVTMRRYVPRDI
ncbi:MAG: flippase-like domain-containing protein [Massilia sp.]|nr:flippase-like domain-containing protein [Massilia sp.]